MDLLETLRRRRTVRDYADDPLPAGLLRRIVWAAQGLGRARSGPRRA